MVLLIDNYDSFSYNLVQYVGVINPDIKVIRNDKYTVEQIEQMEPSHIILSPGPGHPENAGVCEDVIRFLGGKVPILGVCLGHQAICEVFGADIALAPKLMHGKKSKISLHGRSLIFSGLAADIEAARYHSLVALPDTVPEELVITATGPLGEVMAVEHREKQIFGVQFHPESILTPLGNMIIKNFLEIGKPA